MTELARVLVSLLSRPDRSRVPSQWILLRGRGQLCKKRGDTETRQGKHKLLGKGHQTSGAMKVLRSFWTRVGAHLSTSEEALRKSQVSATLAGQQHAETLIELLRRYSMRSWLRHSNCGGHIGKVRRILERSIVCQGSGQSSKHCVACPRYPLRCLAKGLKM